MSNTKDNSAETVECKAPVFVVVPCYNEAQRLLADAFVKWTDIWLFIAASIAERRVGFIP